MIRHHRFSGSAADRKTRKVATCFVLIYLMSLIPILVVARYDCASGDDYGFGAAARQAFVRTGSVAAAAQAARRAATRKARRKEPISKMPPTPD